MQVLRADIQRFKERIRRIGNVSGFRLLMALILSPGMQSVVIFRFGQWTLKQHPLPGFFLRKVHFVVDYLLLRMIWNNELPRRATIGEGFLLIHASGVLIHPQVRAGRNLTLFHQVTIGEGIGPEMVPEIGDNVTIYAGAKVIGKIRIGNNVTIGANAVVYKNIPDNCTVALAPGFTIIKQGQS